MELVTLPDDSEVNLLHARALYVNFECHIWHGYVREISQHATTRLRDDGDWSHSFHLKNGRWVCDVSTGKHWTTVEKAQAAVEIAWSNKLNRLIMGEDHVEE